MKRKFKNLLSKLAREHLSIFLFAAVLFSVGVIFGAVIVNSLPLEQKQDLFYYLSKFFAEVKNGRIATSPDLLITSFQENLKIGLLIWILGVSIIGVPIILIILFSKGIIFGFSIGFLVNQSGWKGFLLACGTILPQNLILVPLYVFLAAFSVILSIKMIKRQFLKEHESLKKYFKLYFLLLIFTIILLIIASLIEVYFSPITLKLISKTI